MPIGKEYITSLLLMTCSGFYLERRERRMGQKLNISNQCRNLFSFTIETEVT